MEHLALEIFDLATAGNPKPTTSKYAVLEPDASITITDTSEIFASGDVWSHSFTLNVHANAHIFGTSGDLHGSRLHDQVHKRRARLWVEGLPLFLGYLKLGDEAEVDADGNVDVGFESGQKTFEEMIEGVSATEVSVGDVVIGVALNRKRVSVFDNDVVMFNLSGLSAYIDVGSPLEGLDSRSMGVNIACGTKTPFVQRWPKLVKSHGLVLDSSGNRFGNTTDADGRTIVDYTNIQTPYDGTDAHPFCNINICYQKKANKNGEEVAARGYTVRLARGKITKEGGDNETRYNNAPNFYLLYFIDRMFKDMKIHVEENQAMGVEDLRRVFLLNYGCEYEEIENEKQFFESEHHLTPDGMLQRYGQYYIPIVSNNKESYVVLDWKRAGRHMQLPDSPIGKVLLRDAKITRTGVSKPLLDLSSVEGTVTGTLPKSTGTHLYIDREGAVEGIEEGEKAGMYSAYLAYATGDNYPHVEINEIIEAMKSMFGIRLLFSNDFQKVRIVLLRNIFRSNEVQDVDCEITDGDEKVENGRRGFRMTYDKGADDTNFYYKGFADLLPRAAKTWKDTSDRHDYSQWDLDAEYDEIKQSVSAMNRICYVTPATGNAYIIKVDEDEDVLFPSLMGAADFMDAEDGDCSGDSETVEEVQLNAGPVIMNSVGDTYASLFGGDMKAPSPTQFLYANNIAAAGRYTKESIDLNRSEKSKGSDTYDLTITGKLDVYINEGFEIKMLDNYAVSNGGTPFDEADPGLQFGIMRSSGSDAFVRYYDDPDEEEDNDTWEVEPGSGAVSHPDTCDNHGRLWDYDGSTLVSEGGTAVQQMERIWPDSNVSLVYSSGSTRRNADTYISSATIQSVEDDSGTRRSLLFATALGANGQTVLYTGKIKDYAKRFRGMTPAQMKAFDAGSGGFGILIETGSTADRMRTLLDLQKRAFLYNDETADPITVDDNGVGSEYGRFSLKLRAEKLNPYFNPRQEESASNPRYLQIDDDHKNLRQRGLCDQFYKEYSYWVRNARIVKRTVRMELAQLLTIDKTVRVRIGDVTGFIRKMQYSVSNKTGLGEVVMEIMYI